MQDDSFGVCGETGSRDLLNLAKAGSENVGC